MSYAHSRNQEGTRHPLVDHLRGTAQRARQFGDAFGAGPLAYYLGLWHDLGKFNPRFQEYLVRCEADPAARGHGPDHKAAGAGVALRILEPLALLIQGHHGGIGTPTGVKSWLAQHANDPAVADALDRACRVLPDLEPDVDLQPPAHVQADRLAAELFLRMTFSALVDADYLDTESHFALERAEQRGPEAAIEQLWNRFERSQNKLTGRKAGTVNAARHEIYQACLRAADIPPGMFRLTVPTGAGKTRSAMAFALRHAMQHGHQRVIVAVPFVTITEQTAGVYRGIFETSDEAEPVVLEHHSAAAIDEGEDFQPNRVWARLAAENWDAPIVVTTTVQLFQSLFSNMPGRTRKIHRLARSVIILDEAQALPPHLLTPMLDVLRQLCEYYGATVVLSTATQPAFEAIREFADLPATEIVPDASRYFRTLSRVRYEWRTDESMPWDEVARLMREEKQALAVVNTKNDALSLLQVLDDTGALHLSTMLCGAHRQWVIKEVKRRLDGDEPCRLVSTQVIEAGVDLDFPLVVRALGPLDGIIQSAGRCNREGRLETGRVVVFRPSGGGLPSGSYRTATDITLAMLKSGPIDLDRANVPREYFRRLFASLETDRNGIQRLRRSLDFPEVASRFRMIDDETESVIIPNYGTPKQQAHVRSIVERLPGEPNPRFLLRRLQPFTVPVYRGQVPSLERAGLVAQIMPGLLEWRGDYHATWGIGGATTLDPDQLIV